jgi:hypothetical protein
VLRGKQKTRRRDAGATECRNFGTPQVFDLMTNAVLTTKALKNGEEL